MKKEIENKKQFIIDLSSSEPSSDESDNELHVENIDKDELKKYLQTDEDDESIKKISSKKSKKLIKKRKTSSSNSDDQNQAPESIKKPKKSSPKKSLLKGDDFKRLQKKAKKVGATPLDYSKRKNNKYMVEYEGKKIHFGSVNTEDFIIHKDPDRRDKYRTKAMKITNKDGEFTYQFPSYPKYLSIKRNTSIKYKRIKIETKLLNGKISPLVVETPFLFSFGVSKGKNQETGELNRIKKRVN